MSSQRDTTVVVSGPEEKSAPSETRNASAIPATTGMWELARSCRAPKAATAAPRSGKNGISQTYCTKKPLTTPLLTSLSPLEPGLDGVGRLDAGGGQLGVRLGTRDGLDRLGLGRLVRSRLRAN